MTEFIDRDREWNTLQQQYDSPHAAFVVIYGRRRVGKTRLITEFCREKRSIYFLATQENEEQNINAFRLTVAAELGNELLAQARLDRWEAVFDVIAAAAEEEERLILVLDEFQYLGKANPAFPSVLMKIWDEKLKNRNIMLILCGSLIRMMTSQVLNYGSPLYGRRTAQLRMGQIPFRYYHDFMPGRSEDELIQRYAVTGGVSKYIELFRDEDDIYQAIANNVLDSGSFLYAEPEFLLSQEIQEPGNYFSVLRAIAAGNHKLDRISSFLEIKQTNLSSYLKILTDLDLIEREVPVTENPQKSRRGLYKIKDNFFAFWFQFVYPYLGLLEAGRSSIVLDRIRNGFIQNHVSYVFENICRENIWELYADEYMITRVGRWWNNRQEIDVVALDESGDDILFGECKYSVQPKGMDVYYALRDKSAEVNWKNTNRKEHYAIFSRSGFTPELVEFQKKEEDLKLIPVGKERR